MSVFSWLPRTVPCPGEKGVRWRWTQLTRGRADWGPRSSQGGLNNSDSRKKVDRKKKQGQSQKTTKQKQKQKPKNEKTKYDKN